MSDSFSPHRLLPLDVLAPGAAIHVIGACGVAMAPLAMALADRGFRVSGSDRECFEPMGSRLRGSSVSLRVGFDPRNIPHDVSLVIPGNTAKEDNPEVQEIVARQLSYSIFPQLLYELLIKDRHSIVVTGTHGKSTTTTLLATVFHELGSAPNWFIGGQPVGMDPWHEGSGTISIVEGDEYTASFFAPVPKFTYYRPDTLVVNAIELDHVDVYPDLRSVQDTFTRLVHSVPTQGNVVVAIDDPELAQLASNWRSDGAPITTFGSSAGADVRLSSRTPRENGRQGIQVTSERFGDGSWELPLTGRHNASNSIAAWICGRVHGFPSEEIARALSLYRGLQRRQQVRMQGVSAVLIEDFAHHPTSIRETLQGLRERYPDRQVWALFEPRTASNRRGVFRDRYSEAFRPADHVLLLDVLQGTDHPGGLDTRAFCEQLRASGIDALSSPDPHGLVTSLLGRLTGRDLVVVMSSGPFGGIIPLLEEELRNRETM